MSLNNQLEFTSGKEEQLAALICAFDFAGVRYKLSSYSDDRKSIVIVVELTDSCIKMD
jgi:hypothetical protein